MPCSPELRRQKGDAAGVVRCGQCDRDPDGGAKRVRNGAADDDGGGELRLLLHHGHRGPVDRGSQAMQRDLNLRQDDGGVCDADDDGHRARDQEGAAALEARGLGCRKGLPDGGRRGGACGRRCDPRADVRGVRPPEVVRQHECHSIGRRDGGLVELEVDRNVVDAGIELDRRLVAAERLVGRHAARGPSNDAGLRRHGAEGAGAD